MLASSHQNQLAHSFRFAQGLNGEILLITRLFHICGEQHATRRLPMSKQLSCTTNMRGPGLVSSCEGEVIWAGNCQYMYSSSAPMRHKAGTAGPRMKLSPVIMDVAKT